MANAFHCHSVPLAPSWSRGQELIHYIGESPGVAEASYSQIDAGNSELGEGCNEEGEIKDSRIEIV